MYNYLYLVKSIAYLKCQIIEFHLFVMQWHKPKTSGFQPPPLRKHSVSLAGRKMFIIGGSFLRQDPIRNSVVEEYNGTIVFDTGTFTFNISISVTIQLIVFFF